MSLLQAILMGIIQGLTEFLPVSSSGHLAIFKILFGVDTETGLLFDVLLHIGTLAAICVVYYKDVLKMIVEGIGLIRDCIINFVRFIGNKTGRTAISPSGKQQLPQISCFDHCIHDSNRNHRSGRKRCRGDGI